MNDLQNDKNTMYLTAEKHLADHATDYATHPKIAPAKTKLSLLIQKISEADARAIVNMTGVAQDKAKERIDLEKICFFVANALNSYGRTTGSHTLEKQSKYEMSVLEHMRDDTLNTTASLLKNLADPIIALLADERLYPADLTKLETERTEFLAMLANPRTAIIHKEEAGSEVDKLMVDTDALLIDIDGFVNTYRFENPVLWEEWYLARNIINTGGGGGNGGGGNPVLEFSGTLPPMVKEVKGPITYNASTPVVLQNNSNVSLSFQLQQSGALTGMPKTVPPMSSINTTLGDMAPNGNEIQITNSDMTQSASYKVTIG